MRIFLTISLIVFLDFSSHSQSHKIPFHLLKEWPYEIDVHYAGENKWFTVINNNNYLGGGTRSYYLNIQILKNDFEPVDSIIKSFSDNNAIYGKYWLTEFDPANKTLMIRSSDTLMFLNHSYRYTISSPNSRYAGPLNYGGLTFNKYDDTLWSSGLSGFFMYWINDTSVNRKPVAYTTSEILYYDTDSSKFISIPQSNYLEYTIPDRSKIHKLPNGKKIISASTIYYQSGGGGVGRRFALLYVNKNSVSLLHDNALPNLSVTNDVIVFNNKIWIPTNQGKIIRFSVPGSYYYITLGNADEPVYLFSDESSLNLASCGQNFYNYDGVNWVICTTAPEIAFLDGEKINQFYVLSNENWVVQTNFRTLLFGTEKESVQQGLNGIPDDFEMAIYPNPSSSEITIESPEIIIGLQMYSPEGKCVLTIPAPNSQKLTLHLPEHQISKGVYFIKLTTESNTYTQKIVIAD